MIVDDTTPYKYHTLPSDRNKINYETLTHSVPTSSAREAVSTLSILIVTGNQIHITFTKPTFKARGKIMAETPPAAIVCVGMAGKLARPLSVRGVTELL